MKIYFCIVANQQLVVPEDCIVYMNTKILFIIHASKVFVINIVPTAVKSPKGDMPIMGMNFSTMKNVKFKFDLINEIEEGTPLYDAVIKHMENEEQQKTSKQN
jgi:hypothetical protein